MRELLNWSVENGMAIYITLESGKLVITANCGNIFASYKIPESCNEKAIGQALHAALRSVRTGTEHRERLDRSGADRKTSSPAKA